MNTEFQKFSIPFLYVLTGPTGIGKSRLGIKLALRHNGEIISADSRQIYRYMDIGTAKPGFSDRNQVRHHLLDLFSPEDVVSAGSFAELADKAMKDIWKRGKNAFMVGGSGLYIRAGIRGIFEGPGRNEKIRDRLEKEAERYGLKRLYNRLQRVDGEGAAKIHPNDKRRIIRALEVYIATKKKISEWQKDTPLREFSCIMAGIRQDMKNLYRKIDARVDEMIEKGLVDEVKDLVKKGFGRSFALKDTIGYKEILDYFEGEMELAEAVDLLKKNSRRFAKRQMTWLRGEKGLKWIEVKQEEGEEEILERLEEAFGLREGERRLAKKAV